MIQGLSIRLFGTPTISKNGQTIKFATQKSLALFIYLVTEGTPQPRPKLMSLLWPRSGTTSAQASLRNALARMRAALSPIDEIIVATPNTIKFVADTATFLDCDSVTQAIHAIQQNDQVISPPQVHSAIKNYYAPFLDAFSVPNTPEFDFWITVQREKWQRNAVFLFNCLSHYYLKHHALAEAIATAQQWVQHAPADEVGIRCLMQGHYLSGERGTALQVFRSAKKTLAEEYNVPPSPETLQLAERIKNGNLTMPHPSHTGAASAGMNVTLPLVGRADEFAQMVNAFQMEDGQLQSIVVSGETGVGKTRLLTDFLDWVSLQGGNILYGQTFETRGNLPYQPVIDALRRWMALDGSFNNRLDNIWLAELSHLLPELRATQPALKQEIFPAENGLSTPKLFEGVFRFCDSLCGNSRLPLVFCLDNWQWADDASLDLLQYLVQRGKSNQSNMLLIFSLLPEQMTVNIRPQNWLVSLQPTVSTTQLSLGRLSASATLELVQAWLGASEPTSDIAAVAHHIYNETDGNPFFIVETLALLTDRLDLSPPQVDVPAILAHIKGGIALPASIHKALLSRLEALDETGRAMLTAASVLERNFRFKEMCDIAGVSEMDGLSTLDILLRRKFIVETHNSDYPYAFAHEKIREVVYANAGHSRRRIFRQRAFDMLKHAAPAAERADRSNRYTALHYE